MDPRGGEGGRPSLLAAEGSGTTRVGGSGLLAGLDATAGSQAARPRSPRFGAGRSRHVLSIAAIATVGVALVLGWSLIPRDGRVRPAPESAAGTDVGVSRARNGEHAAARIVDEPVVALRAPGLPHTGSAEVSGGGVEDPVRLLLGLPADQAATRPAPPRRRPAPRRDTDVDLLATLMQYTAVPATAQDMPLSGPAATSPVTRPSTVQPSDRVTRALADCPAANTAEGLACRRAICEGAWGLHPSCPKPRGSAVVDATAR